MKEEIKAEEEAEYECSGIRQFGEEKKDISCILQISRLFHKKGKRKSDHI
jgi:hypothetical protein